MVVVRTVSGSFAILSGSATGVLSSIFLDGIRGNHRIVGFCYSAGEYQIMLSLT